jgi:MFS transporter, ACS family, hexuronate transporter
MDTMARTNQVESPHCRPVSRWVLVALVSAAIAISYFDRQTVSVAIAAIQRTIPISNEQFSYLQTGFLLAYAAMYAIGGRMLDKLGTRFGFLLIMLWWS